MTDADIPLLYSVSSALSPPKREGICSFRIRNCSRNPAIARAFMGRHMRRECRYPETLDVIPHQSIDDRSLG